MKVMDTKTLKALKGSIEKWKKIERSTRALDTIKNCPLCVLFYHNNCKECPVSGKTTQTVCYGSPYIEWSEHISHIHIHFKTVHRAKDCPTCLDLATKERKFLESLLPVKGEK